MTDEPILRAVIDPGDLRAALAEVAALGPVAVDEATGALWVLGYDEIDRLAHDGRMRGVGLTMFDFMGIDGALRRWYGSLMFTNEGDSHLRLRRLVSRAFTPRSAERLRDVAAELVKERFDQLAADGEGDLVTQFDRVAMRVMCRLLGVPVEDVDIFGDWADALSPVFAMMDPEQIAAATTALDELLEYVADLAAKRDGDPRDDLITALLGAEADGDRLTRGEVVDMVANLLVGGHDTTTSQMLCTFYTLLRFPDSVTRLRTAGATAIPAAVSETMRYEPSIMGIPRTASEAIEIGGKSRPAGTMVVLSLMTGNRDPLVWDDANRFDIERFSRPQTPKLLSFGAGVHYCLGAAVARMTVEETVAGMAARDITPRNDLDAVEWRVVLGRSPASLPVSVN